jgi:hypothetical protein
VVSGGGFLKVLVSNMSRKSLGMYKSHTGL